MCEVAYVHFSGWSAMGESAVPKDWPVKEQPTAMARVVGLGRTTWAIGKSCLVRGACCRWQFAAAWEVFKSLL